jgi:hypothetical protein
MSQTLQSFLAEHPKARAATQNLQFNKKLRRSVVEQLLLLKDSTSPRDLANKIISKLSSDTSLSFLFGEDKVKSMDKTCLIYERLELPIKLSVEAYTGLISKSMFEVEMYWSKASKSDKLKYEDGNLGVHLAPQSDMNRIYVTDASVQVAIVPNLVPYHFLEKDGIKDRSKLCS